VRANNPLRAECRSLAERWLGGYCFDPQLTAHDAASSFGDVSKELEELRTTDRINEVTSKKTILQFLGSLRVPQNAIRKNLGNGVAAQHGNLSLLPEVMFIVDPG